VFERKQLTAGFGAAIALLAMSLSASASVSLELAVHEAARTARLKKIDKVLVIVRESSRSANAPEIAGVLRAVEKMAFDMLKKESGVEGIVERKLRDAVGKTKARTAMRPSEVRRFTTLTDSKAGAVLNLDYKEVNNRSRHEFCDSRSRTLVRGQAGSGRGESAGRHSDRRASGRNRVDRGSDSLRDPRSRRRFSRSGACHR